MTRPAMGAALVVLKLGLVGCERRAVYPIRATLDAGFGSLRLAVAGDDCPAVIVTASPAEARIGESIGVRARIDNAAPDGVRTYSWTASASRFADPSAAETTYTCPGRDRAGPQTLTLQVSNGSCTTTQQATVSCYALADGGGPATTQDPDSGAGEVGAPCAHGEPTTCEGDLCNQCTTDNCPTLANVTIQGGTPTAGCDIYLTVEQQAQCQRLYACMRDRGCVRNNDPTVCWCGAVDPERCETGQEPAGGPCLQEIIAAAGTTDPTLIELRLTDATFPIGGAINLVSCRSVACSALSDPANPVCRL